jgi:hypothetical protein
VIELDVAAVLGADRHESTDERLRYRNGYRSRTLTTQVGDLALQIPKLRAGSFNPIDPGAPPPDRSSLVCGDQGGLHRWGLHAQG